MEKTDRSWLWRIIDLINPLRDPSLTVAVVLTIIEEAGQHDSWYWIVPIGLVNWLAVRGLVWLIVNFTFASTFIFRRLWWAIRHPRLAWRILDAVGHEEIVIGGLPTLPEGMLMPDGTSILSMSSGMGGFQMLGELPPGAQMPLLGMPGQMAPNFSGMLGGSGFYPGMEQQNLGYAQSNGMYGQQTTDGFPQSFPQRTSEEEERLRQSLDSYIRLLEDWAQFTEEKWRTISDSQLGWKPLRGRWGNWDDIFQDTYAAKTSDPMAKAAQDAGEANARRYDNSREKGSAAAAVACFLRDMMTLRRGLEMLQGSPGSPLSETSGIQPVVTPNSPPSFGNAGNSLRGNSPGGSGLGRNSLIRRPAQIFVDANTEQ